MFVVFHNDIPGSEIHITTLDKEKELLLKYPDLNLHSHDETKEEHPEWYRTEYDDLLVSITNKSYIK